MTAERLKGFSDGVFAVAITLLVLDLHVPQVAPDQIGPQLLNLWPAYASYALSFVVVGVYWVAHWSMCQELERADRNLAWINIGLLASIAFIPFPAALLSRYPTQRPVVILYGATLVVTGLFLRWLWVYAHRAGFLGELPPGLGAYAARLQLTPPAIYLAGMLAAFINTWLAVSVYFVVPLLYVIPSRWVSGRPLQR